VWATQGLSAVAALPGQACNEHPSGVPAAEVRGGR
jgi:hypothetical protein